MLALHDPPTIIFVWHSGTGVLRKKMKWCAKGGLKKGSQLWMAISKEEHDETDLGSVG